MGGLRAATALVMRRTAVPMMPLIIVAVAAATPAARGAMPRAMPTMGAARKGGADDGQDGRADSAGDARTDGGDDVRGAY